MNANELRRAFTDFFTQRDHLLVPSASLIPHDDTLLFTNSGMVPFKPYFVGEETPPSRRVVSVQKCVRAGGKHNDLDEVGRTSRHLTFFEMMGNFSFGDYFKSQAIPQAWEFFTEVLKLDPERLWVTVHLSDDEAEEIWAETVGIPRERIQRLDADNWWRMADTGPNGPSSEIFWDKGPAYGPDGGPANPAADERYVEIWNLVFMQFDTDEAGNSTPLPKPSIDTGAGLERILSVLQGKDSVFEIDEMAALISAAESITGYKLGADPAADLALRVLAEHGRTMTFLISDGVLPSNEDRGYVLRRIMRRAVRFAYLLGVTDLVTPHLVDAVVGIMAADYPQLTTSHELVRTVVEREETQFRRTLANGLKILDDQLAEIPAGGELPGSVAFLLHDTYGFPYEVSEEVVRERGYTLDRAGFDDEMSQQRQRAKEARKGVVQAADFEQVQAIAESHGLTDFLGREPSLTDVDAWVLAVTGLGTDSVSIFLDRTPFYAESGGQVGDTGTITTDTGTATVTNTLYAIPGVVRHLVSIEGEILVGQAAKASIDVERRNAIRRNHTATHLLQWALGQVLGDHVKQQGSLVNDDRLRFDFSHFEAVTAAEIAAIEDLANREVLANPKVEHPEVTKAEAEAMGAIAFFGDKYGDLVRVLRAGPSLEFCGGTHVSSLGDIGLIKVVSEGSVGSNIRRIEAVTGTGALTMLREEQAIIDRIADAVNVPRGDVTDGVEKRLVELKAALDEIKTLRKQLALGQSSELAATAVDGVVVARVDGPSRDDLRELVLAVRDQPGVRAVVIGGAPQGGEPHCWLQPPQAAICSRATSSPQEQRRSREAAARAPTSPWRVERTPTVSTRRFSWLRLRRRLASSECGFSGSTSATLGSVSR
ncbi:MAG: alanine--tRNA ligase [Acidimicrobiales bacterium]